MSDNEKFDPERVTGILVGVVGLLILVPLVLGILIRAWQWAL